MRRYIYVSFPYQINDQGLSQSGQLKNVNKQQSRALKPHSHNNQTTYGHNFDVYYENLLRSCYPKNSM